MPHQRIEHSELGALFIERAILRYLHRRRVTTTAGGIRCTTRPRLRFPYGRYSMSNSGYFMPLTLSSKKIMTASRSHTAFVVVVSHLNPCIRHEGKKRTHYKYQTCPPFKILLSNSPYPCIWPHFYRSSASLTGQRGIGDHSPSAGRVKWPTGMCRAPYSGLGTGPATHDPRFGGRTPAVKRARTQWQSRTSRKEITQLRSSRRGTRTWLARTIDSSESNPLFSKSLLGLSWGSLAIDADGKWACGHGYSCGSKFGLLNQGQKGILRGKVWWMPPSLKSALVTLQKRSPPYLFIFGVLQCIY